MSTRLVILVLAAALGSRASGAPAQPLTLEEARQEALRNHPAYAAAQLRVLLAKEATKEAQAAYLPTASGYVDAVSTAWDNTRILAGGINNPSVYDRLGEGVAVSQLITDFGRTSSLAHGAKSQARAAEQGAESSREQVLLNVEASYLAALQARAVLEVAQGTLESRRLLVEQVAELARNKLRSALDVSFAQVALSQAELLVQKAQGDVEVSVATLASALGRRDETPLALSDNGSTPAPIPELHELVASALSQRPDILALRYQRDAAVSLAHAAKDANYPTLSAAGYLGNTFAADTHLPSKYGAAGVQLTVPLFEGGAYLARQHEAEIRARVSEEALREAEDMAVRDVRLARVSALIARQRLATTGQLLDHASQALELAGARYKVGSASIVELGDAQLNQTSAAIAFANARFDVRIQDAVLAFAGGTLR